MLHIVQFYKETVRCAASGFLEEREVEGPNAESTGRRQGQVVEKIKRLYWKTKLRVPPREDQKSYKLNQNRTKKGQTDWHKKKRKLQRLEEHLESKNNLQWSSTEQRKIWWINTEGGNDKKGSGVAICKSRPEGCSTNVAKESQAVSGKPRVD